MTLQIHCPHCAANLAVPEDAGGRKGRCPSCRNTFRVPDPQSMLEDSVTCWLEEVARHDDDAIGPPPGNGKAEPTPVAPNAAPARPIGESIAKQRVAQDKPKPAPEPTPVAASEPLSPAASSSVAVAEPKQKRESRPVSLGKVGGYKVRSAIRPIARVEDPEDAKYREPVKPIVRKPIKPADGATEANGDRVMLDVIGVSAAGVTFNFTSNLMNRPAFRASMPMSCMLCGTTEPGSLVARPLGWIDKATGKKADPGQIETVYEVEVKSHQTPREVTDTIRTIDELNPPFNQPMPYYICHGCAPKVTYVHAEAMSVPSGVVCEVRIPAVTYALRWLGRVNGVCGDAYETLEQQVVAFTDERWRETDEKVRQRISAWFDFQPGEQYLGYISDSDFAKKDAGLAGLVITDTRLVYCKYHHHGAIDLTDPTTTLVATADGAFHELTWEHDGARRRIVRLRASDNDQLIELLREAEAQIGFEMR